MKRIITSVVAMGAITAVQAQSAMDALSVTQNDFKGTARYMSMGGAFTALGGDMSAIQLNPGGIGVYRNSEIGATLDINIQKTKGSIQGVNTTNTQTKAFCNNFGYVGTVKLDGPMRNLNWGVTYGRAKSFDRVVGGYAPSTETSLTNYIASFTNGTPAADMEFGNNSDYNPYQNSDADWLSILAYSGYMINPTGGATYQGLYAPGTNADAQLWVEEKGYVDNYTFTFGGNISNMLYWGVGVGIDDLKYTRFTNYSESMENARIVDAYGSGTVRGDAGYTLRNWKEIKGTGYNLSFGVIVKPIQEVRIGASIKSPTWYSLDQSYSGDVDFSYFNPAVSNGVNNPLQGSDYTDKAWFEWRLRSPWRFNVGAAAVIGSQAIVSVDYERIAYPDMTVKDAAYDNWGYTNGFYPNDYVNQDIKDYTQSANNVRAGIEYRVTPAFSVRLGTNITKTNIKNEVSDGNAEIITSGTDPSYTLDKTTTYVTAGLGYRWGGWYIDGTYVYKNRTSTMHPYTSFAGGKAPVFDVTDNNSSIVLSLGYKF